MVSWGESFIEDERMKFGGRGTSLNFKVDDYNSPVNKFLLQTAQALDIADDVLDG